jgi:ADP-ribosylglycohydrolase
MNAIKQSLSRSPASTADFGEQTYAGVLGKIVGVYLGRAVEGWSYKAITDTFGEIDYYVNDRVGSPLIVPDDDISGTFLFYQALEDNGFPNPIDAATIGDTWLNYIIEDKTVLWWGGLGRSTEHSAYLRLKAGIRAPESGSAKLNSRAMAEAIGAEIFIDTWALSNPGEPERAAAMARAAASVSHDGIAVEAAVLLAAMEAAAFVEPDIGKLLDLGSRFSRSDELRAIVDQVRDQCAKANHWRSVRQWLEENHSYRHYPGCCPMVPNHALLLASLIMGGDDLQRGMMIAVSSGWDTDCNAGNLACLTGIRLGMRAFQQGPDFRAPVADQIYVVGADGGDCFSDAVIETRRVRRAAAALSGIPYAAPTDRFAFEYPGAVQGFRPCPHHEGRQAITRIGNTNEAGGDHGLELRFETLAKGMSGSVSVQTFIDPRPLAQSETSYFEVISSPSLYGTQTLTATIRTFDGVIPELCFYVIHYNGSGVLTKLRGEKISLRDGDTELRWQVPPTGGLPIQRLGIEISSETRLRGRLAVLRMDWAGAPAAFVMGSAYDLSPKISPFDTSSYWLKSFVSSALHFRPDVDTTFALSHPGDNGVVTIGTRDWQNYSVSARMTMDLHEYAGLVARARGHRRYYAAVLGDQTARIVCRMDSSVHVLASAPFLYAENQKLKLTLSVRGDLISFDIEGQEVVSATDARLASGGAGMVVAAGTIPVLGFAVQALA